jgi:hypothetical protein
LRPGGEAAVADPARLVAVDAERPPDAGRVEAGGVVVHDEGGPVADSGAAGRGGDLLGAAEECRRGLTRLDKLGRPVEVRRPRDVAPRVHLPPGAVGPPADIDHPQLAAAEVLGEPLCRREELRTGVGLHRA